MEVEAERESREPSEPRGEEEKPSRSAQEGVDSQPQARRRPLQLHPSPAASSRDERNVSEGTLRWKSAASTPASPPPQAWG